MSTIPGSFRFASSFPWCANSPPCFFVGIHNWIQRSTDEGKSWKRLVPIDDELTFALLSEFRKELHPDGKEDQE
jgi:hypothetical protein